ncbi:MAG: hypothetical protein OEL55_06660, partial [Desulfobulbaceae bacterium]|nr:hypothetical protein [Desulfobulbaceae bacterium]
MDPAALIPTPDTIPVAWGWFQFLLMLTFVLHLLLMNAMLGGGIIALITHLIKPKGSPVICQQMAHKLTYLIAFAVNFGVAPLLFLQVIYGHFFYTSSVLMARHWLTIIALLILAYSSAYIYHIKYKALGEGRVRVLALVVAPLLVIGFLFSNNMTLMLHPETWQHYFNQPNGTMLNLNDVTLIPRYLHFVVASVAVGGLFIALLNHFSRHENNSNADQRIATGLNWFCGATTVQLGAGVLFLFYLPDHIRQLFLGGAALPTGLLTVGIGIALGAIVLGFLRKIWPTIIATVSVVIIMALIRDLVRKAYLAPYFKPADLTVAPQTQYDLLILFFVLLVITGGIVI